MICYKLKNAVAAIVIMATGQTVQSATTTTTFQVTATINDTCVVSATDLAFGVFDPTATSDNTSTITVTCTQGTSYSIGLNAGTTSGATVTTRQMSDGGTGLLDYSLFSDAARTVNWGDTVATDTVDVVSASGSPENHTVFGRIALGQFQPAGNYSDTITVTVTF
ncbi:MAG: Csu type fimbrial protein [Gammaproteobacteria bacterium]